MSYDPRSPIAGAAEKTLDLSVQIADGDPSVFDIRGPGGIPTESYVPGSVRVLRNGVHELSSDFTETPPNVVSFTTIVPTVGEKVEIVYVPA